MTTIVIDLTTNQWLALIGAFVMGAIVACLLTWPFVFLNGYEKRSEEKAEAQFDIDALQRNAEALRGDAP